LISCILCGKVDVDEGNEVVCRKRYIGGGNEGGVPPSRIYPATAYKSLVR
jgi:hypothetical protein